MDAGAKSENSVPSRYRYMIGILDGLRSLGGEADSSQMYEWLVAQEVAYPNDLTTIQSDGGTRFHKEVRWARKELFDARLIDAPTRGVWQLTSAGAETFLTPEAARAIVSRRASDRRQIKLGNDLGEEVAGPGPVELALQIEAGPLAGPTTGPRPVAWSGAVSRSTEIQTFTYLMRFGERDVWKVGHASDLSARLADINRHVPSEVLGEAWNIITAKIWPDAVLAYQMEQDILRHLNGHRSVGERIRCTTAEITATWNKLSL